MIGSLECVFKCGDIISFFVLCPRAYVANQSDISSSRSDGAHAFYTCNIWIYEDVHCAFTRIVSTAADH